MAAKRNAEERIQRGLIYMMNSAPFFASILLGLKRMEISYGTMATDGDHLCFNPDWVVKLPEKLLAIVLKHEAMHIAHGHHLRTKRWWDIDSKLTNIAEDAAINHLLKGEPGWQDLVNTVGGIEVGRKPFDDLAAVIEGESAEWYCDYLFKRRKGGEGDSGSGSGNGKADDQNGPEQADGAPPAGSCASNGMGDCYPPTLKEGETIEGKKAKWQMQIAEAAVVAKNAGNFPGYLEELVNAQLRTSKLPWRIILRRFCSKLVQRGRGFRKVNRSFAYRNDIVIPSRWSEGLHRIGFVIDTSGSMSNRELNLAFGEFEAIARQHTSFELVIIQCDTRVTNVREVTPMDFPIDTRGWTWKGRGGTDMTPAFDEAARKNCRAVICLTDGELYKWPEKVSVPLLWLMTRDVVAPCGESIQVD